MNKFAVEIPNDRARTYRLITFIILILNFFVFGFIFVRSAERYPVTLAVAGLVVNAVPLIFFLLNKKHIKSPWLEISFFISAVLTLLWGNYLAAILLVLFSLFGYFANRKKQILFSEEGIVYPSFPAKQYEWTEVEQVIWKDDILTLDLKNNKLMQLNIDKPFADNFPVKEFNEFCRLSLGQNS
ncbi:MAG: hypothetical protein WKF88_08680 [Ferruginibacter sp.]